MLVWRVFKTSQLKTFICLYSYLFILSFIFFLCMRCQNIYSIFASFVGWARWVHKKTSDTELIIKLLMVVFNRHGMCIYVCTHIWALGNRYSLSNRCLALRLIHCDFQFNHYEIMWNKLANDCTLWNDADKPLFFCCCCIAQTSMGKWWAGDTVAVPPTTTTVAMVALAATVAFIPINTVVIAVVDNSSSSIFNKYSMNMNWKRAIIFLIDQFLFAHVPPHSSIHIHI